MGLVQVEYQGPERLLLRCDVAVFTRYNKHLQWDEPDCLLYQCLTIRKKAMFSHSNLPQYHFFHHKSYTKRPTLELNRDYRVRSKRLADC